MLTNGQLRPAFGSRSHPLIGLLWWLMVMPQLVVGLHAASVTLAWDPSPSENITGYTIYMGNDGVNFPNSTNVGDVLEFTLDNLPEGVTNVFAATAHDLYGMESDFSNFVTNYVPVSTPAPTPHITTRPMAIQCVVDHTCTIQATELMQFVADQDGHFLSLMDVGSPTTNNAQVIIQGTSIVFSPAFNSTNDDAFFYVVGDSFGNSATGLVTVTMLVAQPSLAPQKSPKMISRLVQSDGGCLVSFSGVAGYWYQILTATSILLPDWTFAIELQADPDGLIEFYDPPPLAPSKFYRAIRVGP